MFQSLSISKYIFLQNFRVYETISRHVWSQFVLYAQNKNLNLKLLFDIDKGHDVGMAVLHLLKYFVLLLNLY
jgi:hypothetical protein